MDSVTQFALGAGIGAAVLGPRMGLRKAVLAGGLLGSLPDADVFWPFDNAVDSFVLHRSATHSLIVHALATPLLGEGLYRLASSLRRERARAYWAVFLCLTTHALLDSLTVYGTQLFWPIWNEPFGLGSVFIIDPLYTLPLLVLLVWGLIQGQWSARFGRAATAVLLLTTAYLGWGLMAQQWAEGRAEKLLARASIQPERTIAAATPFNTLFWRVIAVEGPRYYNLYVPLLGGPEDITSYAHPRQAAMSDCLAGNGFAATLRAFTNGFYRLDREQDRLVFSDLRMGLTPAYVFRFALAEHRSGGLTDIEPQRIRSPRGAPGDYAWLWRGVRGGPALRPAEAAFRIDLTSGTVAQAEDANPSAC